MSYIRSDKITAFPLAKNRVGDRESNLFYEQNIANIVNQVADTQGFIVTPNIDFLYIDKGQLLMEKNKLLQVSLGGRLFTISTQGEPEAMKLSDVTDGETVYICISVVNGEVSGQDENEFYKGLTITTSGEEVNNHTYTLELANISGDRVTIPETSYLKLNLKSFAPAIKIIDGKR